VKCGQRGKDDSPRCAVAFDLQHPIAAGVECRVRISMVKFNNISVLISLSRTGNGKVGNGWAGLEGGKGGIKKGVA